MDTQLAIRARGITKSFGDVVDAGAHTAAITSFGQSPLTDLVDHVIVAGQQGDRTSHQGDQRPHHPSLDPRRADRGRAADERTSPCHQRGRPGRTLGSRPLRLHSPPAHRCRVALSPALPPITPTRITTQLERQRSHMPKLPHLGRRWVVAGVVVAALATGTVVAAAAGSPLNPFGTAHVGTQADGRVLLPYNQYDRLVRSAHSDLQPHCRHRYQPRRQQGRRPHPGSDQDPGRRHRRDPAGVRRKGRDGAGLLARWLPVRRPVDRLVRLAGTGSISKYTIGANGLVSNPTAPRRSRLGRCSSRTAWRSRRTARSSTPCSTAPTTWPSSTPRPTDRHPDRRRQHAAGHRHRRQRRSSPTAVAARPSPVTRPTSPTAPHRLRPRDRRLRDRHRLGDRPGEQHRHRHHQRRPAAVLRDGPRRIGLRHQHQQRHGLDHRRRDPRGDPDVNVEPLPGSHVGPPPTRWPSPTKATSWSASAATTRSPSSATPARVPAHYLGLIPTDAYPNQVATTPLLGKIFVSNQDGVSTNGAPKSGSVTGTVTNFAMPDQNRSAR